MPGKMPAMFLVQTVKPFNVLRFRLDVERFGCGGLHPDMPEGWKVEIVSENPGEVGGYRSQ